LKINRRTALQPLTFRWPTMKIAVALAAVLGATLTSAFAPRATVASVASRNGVAVRMAKEIFDQVRLTKTADST
jgi:hypothetical protein